MATLEEAGASTGDKYRQTLAIRIGTAGRKTAQGLHLSIACRRVSRVAGSTPMGKIPMIQSNPRFQLEAEKHGVDLASVVPQSHSQRVEHLQRILGDTDVPFPIEPELGRSYLEKMSCGMPFSIGGLNDKTVNLEQYSNAQVYDQLSAEDHLSWACLVADQQATKHRYASREYLRGEEMFQIGGATIPDYYLLNARIYQQTGWQLATVSEIIPADVFFHCHSNKFFPVTTFMRPLGTDYLEEPDIGHDVAGHVATFTIPQVAQVMNYHGLANDVIRSELAARLKAASDERERRIAEEEAEELLLLAGRLYWFTVEFGLVLEDGNLKAFGAGILSSPGETCYSVDSPVSNRVLIDPSLDQDLLRLATTDYLISEFQKTYFVMKDFQSLATLTPERILRVVKLARQLPHHTWREISAGDEVLNVGQSVASPNEKYYQLLNGMTLDDCLERTAIRNLTRFGDLLSTENPKRILPDGMSPLPPEGQAFVESLPGIPAELLRRFRSVSQQGEATLERDSLPG